MFNIKLEMGNYLKKADFARQANVSYQAIKKAIERGVISKGVNSRGVNLDHPDVIKYMQTRHRKDNPDAQDPLFDEVVAGCREYGKMNKNFIHKNFPVSEGRAVALCNQITKAGIVFERKTKAKSKPKPQPVQKKPLVRQAPPKGMTGENSYARKAERLAKEQATEDKSLSMEGIPEYISELSSWSLMDLCQRFGTDRNFVDWLKSIQLMESIESSRIKNAHAMGLLVSREAVKIGVLDHINATHEKILADGSKTIARQAQTMVLANEDLIDIEREIRSQLSSLIKPMKTRITRGLNNAK